MITLAVRRSPGNYGCAYVPEVQNYTGNIIPNPSWVPADSICLTTGDPAFPFRILKKESIVGNTSPISSSKPYRTFTVTSKGRASQPYTVTKDGSTYSCTCVGFSYRRDCKHVHAVIDKISKAA